jgi:hypothetical protein
MAHHVTLGEAARQTGRSKSQISRAIRAAIVAVLEDWQVICSVAVVAGSMIMLGIMLGIMLYDLQQ